MEYTTVEALISEETFVDYCLQRDAAAIARWEQWQHADAQRAALAAEAKAIVMALSSQLPAAEKLAERQRIVDHIAGAGRQGAILRRMPVGRWVAAASVALAIGIGAIWLSRDGTQPPQLAWQRQEVPAGKLLKVRLADGTEVRLTSATRFDYPSVFADSLREVHLAGEAFFDVAHNAAKPFVIKTGDFSIRVLGTSFNVHAFAEDESVQVSLFRGKVEVSNQKIKQVLLPGQSFVYDRKTDSFAIEQLDEAQEQQRIAGSLFFDRADFAELARKLSRKYGIVVPAQQGIHLEYSGTIHNETIEQVIEKLNFTTNYHFLLESNTLIVKQK